MDNKNLTLASYCVLGIALIAAVTVAGYYRSQYLEIKNQAPKEIVKEVVKKVEVKSEDKVDEIAELERELSVLKTQSPNAEKKPIPPKTEEKRRHGKPGFSLVELKANDPERYQEIMEHYKRKNELMASGVADKMIFFNEMDTTGMSEKELANHELLLEKLAKMHESTENISENPEDIRNNMRAQWQNFRELRGLMRNERDYLLLDAGKKMGFDDKEASLMRDYIKNTYEITSGKAFFSKRRRNQSDKKDNK